MVHTGQPPPGAQSKVQCGQEGHTGASSGAHLCLLMLFFSMETSTPTPKADDRHFLSLFSALKKNGVGRKEACWELSPHRRDFLT